VLRALLTFVLLLGVASCSGDDDHSTAATTSTSATTPTAGTEPLLAGYAGYHSQIYADPAHWLCRGDVDDDVCDVDMDATVIESDGSTTVEKFRPVEDAPVDCFYVYPTISTDPVRTAISCRERTRSSSSCGSRRPGWARSAACSPPSIARTR
jgi:hypothetical protein